MVVTFKLDFFSWREWEPHTTQLKRIGTSYLALKCGTHMEHLINRP